MEIKEQIWTAHAEQKVKLSTQVKVEIPDKVMINLKKYLQMN